MSTVKHPTEKKLLALKHERRNVYFENDQASRRLVPLVSAASQAAG